MRYANSSKAREKRTDLKAGSALLVTLLVVSLLMMIVLAFVVGVRVELRKVQNYQSMLHAKANARVGAMIALSELQSHLGPDQRVSAPSAVGGPGVGAEETSPYYVGVWRHAPANNQDTYAPELLTWLVSGNEGLTPPNPNFRNPGELATRNPDEDTAVAWLVNTGSVEVPADILEFTPDPRIRAPVVDLAGTGRYAWWVGDEGVKAKANLEGPAITPTPDLPHAALRAAREVRFDRINGLAPFQGATDDPLIRRVGNLGQLFLGFQPGAEELKRRSFHHLTFSHSGLLTDALNGGLRHDLTQLFSLPLNAFRSAMRTQGVFGDLTGDHTFFDTDTTAYNLIVQPGRTLLDRYPDQARSVVGPTWEQLRSFYRAGDTDEGTLSADGRIEARPHTATQHGFHPLIIQFKFGVGLRREQADSSTDLFFHMRPMVVLANPYTVDLAPQEYVFTFELGGFFTVEYDTQQSTGFDVDGNPVVESVGVRVEMEKSGMVNNMKFRLVSDGIPAGQARVYTLRPGASPGWNADLDSFDWNPQGTYVMEEFYDEEIGIHKRVPKAEAFTHEEASSATVATRNTGRVHGLLFNQDLEKLHYLRNGGHTSGARLMGTGAPYQYSPIFLGNFTSIVWGGGLIQRILDVPTRQTSTGNSSGPLAEVNLRTLMPYTQIINAWDARYPIIHFGGNFNHNPVIFDALSGASFISLEPDFTTTSWLLNTNPGAEDADGVEFITNQLFDLPIENGEFTSIAQLQHFNAIGFTPTRANGGVEFSIADNGMGNVLTQMASNWEIYSNPTAVFGGVMTAGYSSQSYTIGNSRASQYVWRDQVWTNTVGGNDQRIYRDMPYLLNRVLFDRFYFSTVHQTGGTLDAPTRANLRYTPTSDAQDMDALRATSASAAEHLRVDGAFNVNSTSEQAWRALLSGLLEVDYPTEAGSADEAPFPRSLRQSGGSINADTGITENAWSGFRKLTDQDVDDLARAIVHEVRSRGPFLSLGDFVNRRLVRSNDDPDNHGLYGALEAAIHNARTGSNPSLNNRFTHSNLSAGPVNTATRLSTVEDSHIARHWAQGFPGWISQADVLQPLAPYLSARSDTFTIRAYGETGDPDNPLARAWFEMTVQRVPEFMDESQPPSQTRFQDGGLSPLNQRFGRRFEIVGFRWLTPEEI